MAEYTIAVRGTLGGAPMVVGVLDHKIIGDPIAVEMMEQAISARQQVQPTRALPKVVPGTEPVPFYVTAVELFEDVEPIAGEDSLGDLAQPDDVIA